MDKKVLSENENVKDIDFNDNKEINRQGKKVKKSKKQKTKVSFFTVLKRIFLSLIIGVVALATIGYCVLYFAFDIELFSTISQVKKINQTVNADEKFKNQFSDSDLTSLNEKLNAESLDDSAYLISDKQIGAYIDNELKNNSDKNFVGDNDLIKSSDIELVQIDFNNSESKTENYLIDFNIVLKVDLTTAKNSKFNSFPTSIINKYIPSEIYISATVEILSEGDSYKLLGKDLQINALNSSETEKFLSTINNFYKIGDSKQLSEKICAPVVKYLIADLDNETLYDAFEIFGGKSYGFYSENNVDYLIIYKHKLTDVASITYNNTKDAVNDNLTSYSVRDNKIIFQPLECVGYEFLGWYDNEAEVANKVEYVIAWNLKEYNLYAKWKIIEYSITYDMRGGMTSSPNPTTYTIEDELNLNTPYKLVEVVFQGWTFKYTETKELVQGYDNPDLGGKIKKGTYGNLTIYARFDDERILDLYVDGKYQDNMTIILGETFDFDKINENFNPSKVGMSGYSVLKWYSDKDLTNEYNYETLVRDDMSLYGEWVYDIGTLKFYPYISEFSQAINSSQKVVTIDSNEKLEAYFEYCMFYVNNKSVNLNVTYLSNISNFATEIESVVEKIQAKHLVSKSCSYTYKQNLFNGYINFTLTVNDEVASLTMDKDKEYTFTQQNNALKLNFTKTRADDYDDFKINLVTKTIDVSNSSQLVYCLSQGYKPNCLEGSNAEDIFNKAKNVLRQICDDSMTDIEKLRAMYEWLILNVNYDQRAYDVSQKLSVVEARRYDSWYADGVFNNGVAVCEGYAKALIIMARIEGIPIIYVTGNQHAWNKVLVNGDWYGIDATHGDLGCAGLEVNSYKQFLFSDAYKESMGYYTSDYSEIKATKDYDYFTETTYVYDSKEFNLCVENIEDINIIANYITNVVNQNNYENYTFELEFGRDVNIPLAVNVLTVKLKMQFATTSYVNSNGNTNYIFISYDN